MLNVPVDLSDTIIISYEDTRQIFSKNKNNSNSTQIVIDENSVFEICEKDALLNPNLNLATKALRMFFEKFEIDQKVKIKFIKNIPTGAGFAGGSSNAGTLLLWAKERYKANIFERFFKTYSKSQFEYEYEAEVLQLLVENSADSPFFLNKKLSKLTGTGDIITTIDNNELTNKPIALLIPKIKSFTPKVYQIFRETYSDEMLKADPLLNVERLKGFKYREFLALIENDLANVIDSVDLNLHKLLQEFKKISGIKAEMTGAGSAMFALADNDEGVFKESEMNEMKALVNKHNATLLISRII